MTTVSLSLLISLLLLSLMKFAACMRHNLTLICITHHMSSVLFSVLNGKLTKTNRLDKFRTVLTTCTSCEIECCLTLRFFCDFLTLFKT